MGDRLTKAEGKIGKIEGWIIKLLATSALTLATAVAALVMRAIG